MCNLCTRTWIPANHKASKLFSKWTDKHGWDKIFAIKLGSFADIRRHSKMKDKRKWSLGKNTFLKHSRWSRWS